MEENKELSALFHLIDDPDEEVFGAVSNRIIDYGKGIIPNLENLWENTISEGIQERIELLITDPSLSPPPPEKLVPPEFS